MNHRLALILRMARKGGDSLDALPETLIEKLTPKELIPQLKRARVRCEKAFLNGLYRGRLFCGTLGQGHRPAGNLLRT